MFHLYSIVSLSRLVVWLLVKALSSLGALKMPRHHLRKSWWIKRLAKQVRPSLLRASFKGMG